MKRALRIALWILGAGILSLFACAAFGGQWGPCGPSSIWGLVFLLTALACIPVGTVVLVISLIAFVFQRST